MKINGLRRRIKMENKKDSKVILLWLQILPGHLEAEAFLQKKHKGNVATIQENKLLSSKEF